MSRGKRRLKGESIGGQFAGLPFNLIQSRAFAELTGTAVKILMLLMTRYNGRNNGHISFAYSDAEKAGVARRSAQRAFIDLQDKGFIKQTKAGVYRGNVSEWLLTFRSDDRNGHGRTDDWKQYPDNEKDDLNAAKRDKAVRKNNLKNNPETKEANDNAPAPVMPAPVNQNASADADTLLRSLENLKRKQGLS